MIFEKPLENYCHEVCLVFFYAQPLSSYCIISLGEAAQTILFLKYFQLYYYQFIIIFNLLPLLEICAPISPRVFDVQTQNLAKILDRHQEEVLWFLQQIRLTDFEECWVKGPIFPSHNTLCDFQIAISPRVFIRSSPNFTCQLSRVPYNTPQVYRAFALKTPEVDFSPQVIHQIFRTSYLPQFPTDPLHI